MKSLIVLRHAKTEPSARTDHERALLPRGIEQAASLGDELSSLGFPRIYALVSTATRAQQTWAAVAGQLDGTEVQLATDDRLYDADVDDLLDVIGETSDAEETVVVVGHNPSISYLASSLSGEPLPSQPDIAKWGDLRTCRGVLLSYAGDWTDLAPGSCSITAYLAPTID